MSFNDKIADYRASIAAGPGSPPEHRVMQAVARHLASLCPNATGVVGVAEFVAGVRRTLPPRYRARLKRKEVTAALEILGIPTGLDDRRQVIVGFSVETPARVVVDPETGKIREVA